MREPILEVREIAADTGTARVLQPISFSLQERFRLGIAGETGSGKSTLLKALAGLQNLASGSVHWKGKRVEEPWEKLVPGHPSIAYLSQHFELRNNYRVEEILSYAEKMPEQEAAEIYRLCQVHHLLKRKTDQLSGGERQRIAFARLLVGAPTVFLLDEPFSNLDALHKQTMKQVLKDLGDTMQMTWVLVSHDPADLLSWADELLVLQAGRRIQQGAPLDLFYHPVNEYCAGLLGLFSKLSPSDWKKLTGETIQENRIVRPMQFQLSESDNSPLKGVVEATEFMVYGFIVTVRLESQDILKLLHPVNLPLQTAVGVQFR